MNNIPEGFKLVPVVPTAHMIAATVADDQGAKGLRAKIAVDSYNAMLSAAPTPIQSEKPMAYQVAEYLTSLAARQNVGLATELDIFKAEVDRLLPEIDYLRAQLAERDALLTDLGVEPDGVSDVYQRLLLNADRYEYLREHMAVENFPAAHPNWSKPSEFESRRIDELCDSAMYIAKAREDE